MPISIDYDHNKNIIYTKAEGLVRLEDISLYFSSVATLPLKPGYRVFADYSGVDLELSSEDIHKMAEMRQALRNVDTKDKVNIAVYCMKDLIFGVGRMYQALLGEEKYNVMIFRDENEARKWLGI